MAYETSPARLAARARTRRGLEQAAWRWPAQPPVSTTAPSRGPQGARHRQADPQRHGGARATPARRRDARGLTHVTAQAAARPADRATREALRAQRRYAGWRMRIARMSGSTIRPVRAAAVTRRRNGQLALHEPFEKDPRSDPRCIRGAFSALALTACSDDEHHRQRSRGAGLRRAARVRYLARARRGVEGHDRVCRQQRGRSRRTSSPSGREWRRAQRRLEPGETGR